MPLDLIPIKRALISVYDKTNLDILGKNLQAHGVEIFSTGSTATSLRDFGIKVTAIEEYTGFPEILGGRVKTLHPKVHAALLADKNNPEHMKTIADLGIAPFDLVIINLYPFSKTVTNGGKFEECIEQIDIGGPAMLRSSAKNHSSVAVISNPNQYKFLFASLVAGGFTLDQRKTLALETFRATATYDSAIANWLGSELSDNKWFGMTFTALEELRYGENPHQSAQVLVSSNSSNKGIANAQVLHGKAMSFNNYTDGDAALRAAYDHKEPCVAIIKHANPCGIAIGNDLVNAYLKARACDPVSAFGGVVAANREVDEKMAEKVIEIFTEVIVAPDFTNTALEILSKKKDLRIVKVTDYQIPKNELRQISGGLLIQETDLVNADGDESNNWKLVAGQSASGQLMKDLEFAWKAVRAVKSNAILIAKDGASIGVGMGQVNRVDSAKLAVARGGLKENKISDCVAASDAFFPFADGLEILIDAGVRAVVQPGGSIRDEEVIAAANKAGITMYFTGVRHFSHA